MSDTKKKDTLVLRVIAREDKSYYHTFKVDVDILTLEENSRTYGDDFTTKSQSYPENMAQYYQFLQLYCITFHDSLEPSNNAELAYSQPYKVDMREAERMYKTLARIDRALDKIRETEGWAQSFGQTVNRLARVLGAKYVLVMRSREAIERTGEKYQWLSLGDAVFHIDYLTRDWMQKLADAKKVTAE